MLRWQMMHRPGSRSCAALGSPSGVLSSPAVVSSLLLPQRRLYWFFPTSLAEVQQRLRQILQKAEKRTIWVRLYDRMQLPRKNSLTASSTNGGAGTKALPWHIVAAARRKQRKRKSHGMAKRKLLLLEEKQRRHHYRLYGIAPPLPVAPSAMLPPSLREVMKQHFRWRRDRMTQQFKVRREQLRLGRDRMKQQLRMRRDQKLDQFRSMWARRRRWNPLKVTLTEESHPSWFHPLDGRPLASRDELGRFVNPWSSVSTNGVQSLWNIVRWKLQRTVRKTLLSIWPGSTTTSTQKVIRRFPPQAPPAISEELHQQQQPTAAIDSKLPMKLTWVGHSTCIVEMKNDIKLLTDPMLSHRAGPYQSIPIGVGRMVPPSSQLQDDVFDICLISHDHYDHLDLASVRSLRDRVSLWVVPTGLRDYLIQYGKIARETIVELKWWESVQVAKIHNGKVATRTISIDEDVNLLSPSTVVTCCPAQHWSGRTLWDRNVRLWCSFAVHDTEHNERFYFGGDTALPTEFPLFQQIGDRLGPFDLAALPIGAYAPSFYMQEAHCNPTEAVQIYKYIRAKKSVGIHWGTFELSEEDVHEPAEWLYDLQRAEEDLDFVAIQHGESVYAAAQSVEQEERSEDATAPDEGKEDTTAAMQ